MHWGVIAGVTGVAAATAMVAATGDEVRRYPLPVSAAAERLASAPLPHQLLAIAGHDVSVVRLDDGLLWRLGPSGSFSEGRAMLTGDGATTDVTLEFNWADGALGGSRLSSTKLTRSIAGSVFREHVDSVLSGRRFDQRSTMMDAAREVRAKPEMVQEYSEAMARQFDDVAKMVNEGHAGDSSLARPLDGQALARPTADATNPATNL